MIIGQLKRETRFFQVILAVLIMAVIGLAPAPAKAWLYYSAPPIQGTITDATTGKPIANAVLAVRWMKSGTGPFGSLSAEMKKLVVATDGNGVFRIPGYLSIHILTSFKSVNWVARHPLYSTIETGIGRADIDVLRQSGGKMVNEQADIHKYASLGAAGEIVFNFSRLSLKEKFKEKPRTDGSHGALDGEFLFEGPKYFSFARLLGLSVDTAAIYKEWDEIGARFKDVEYVQEALKSGKNRIAEGFVGDWER